MTRSEFIAAYAKAIVLLTDCGHEHTAEQLLIAYKDLVFFGD